MSLPSFTVRLKRPRHFSSLAAFSVSLPSQFEESENSSKRPKNEEKSLTGKRIFRLIGPSVDRPSKRICELEVSGDSKFPRIFVASPGQKRKISNKKIEENNFESSMRKIKIQPQREQMKAYEELIEDYLATLSESQRTSVNSNSRPEPPNSSEWKNIPQFQPGQIFNETRNEEFEFDYYTIVDDPSSMIESTVTELNFEGNETWEKILNFELDDGENEENSIEDGEDSQDENRENHENNDYPDEESDDEEEFEESDESNESDRPIRNSMKDWNFN